MRCVIIIGSDLHFSHFKALGLMAGILSGETLIQEPPPPTFDPSMFLKLGIRQSSHILESSYYEPNPNPRRENNCHHTPFYRGLKKYATRHKR